MKIVTFPIGYINSIDKIINNLKKLDLKGNKVILHLNIYDTRNNDLI